MDFSGKRVLVTGGGQGIGLAIVKKFLQLGAHVVVLDKNEKCLEALTAAHGAQVTAVQVDLADWDGTQAAVKGVLPIHHLINNVGIFTLSPLIAVSKTEVDLMFNINYKAALAVSQVVATDMIERGMKGATIVNVSSVADSTVKCQSGGEILPCGVYACTKAAIAMFTKFLAAELLPRGVRVNSIRPGAANTELITGLPEEVKEAKVKPIADKHIYKELIEPEDVANAAVFLSSPMSYRMTGSALTVDAGFDIQ